MGDEGDGDKSLIDDREAVNWLEACKVSVSVICPFQWRTSNSHVMEPTCHYDVIVVNALLSNKHNIYEVILRSLSYDVISTSSPFPSVRIQNGADIRQQGFSCSDMKNEKARYTK